MTRHEKQAIKETIKKMKEHLKKAQGMNYAYVEGRLDSLAWVLRFAQKKGKGEEG